MTLPSSDALWHAHIYYQPHQRDRAAGLREGLLTLRDTAGATGPNFVGDLRDAPVGPHPLAQFEIHFLAGTLPALRSRLAAAGLTVLIHPLTNDDLADHTTLADWIGAPLALDLSVLDPPGVNQGVARFGRSDF